MKKLKPSKNLQPFNVTCHFGDGSGKAIIKPRYENDFQYTSIPGGSDGCADPGCYTDNIRCATCSNVTENNVILVMILKWNKLKLLSQFPNFVSKKS